MTPEEKAAKKRAYHSEWQRRNKDKIRVYNERYFVRKAAKIQQQQTKEKGSEQGCFMCTNAHTDPELTSNDDLSYITIGDSAPKKRMMFRTGDGRTTQIITEEFNEKSGCWQLVGFYRPKFCPNCGRELIENRKGCSRDFR